MARADYVFARVEDRRELIRLQTIEEVFDPGTQRRLLATGLRAGWRCLEVGPGAGSIMRWLGKIVAPAGRVVALELAPTFLQRDRTTSRGVVQADVRAVPLAPGWFDLVHARFVLIHLADFRTALAALLGCLKPGGWIVLEEPDFSASRPVDGNPEDVDAMHKVNRAIARMFADRGMDPAFGLRLPALLEQSGMTRVIAEHEAPVSPGGSGMATVMRMSAVQLREKYLATGVVTEGELDQYARFAEDPRTRAVYHGTVAVSGRKPA